MSMKGFSLLVGAVHDGTQHLEHVGAFGISHVLVGVLVARRNEAQAHLDWSSVVGSDTEIVPLQDAAAEPVPEFEVILPPVVTHSTVRHVCTERFLTLLFIQLRRTMILRIVVRALPCFKSQRLSGGSITQKRTIARKLQRPPRRVGNLGTWHD